MDYNQKNNSNIFENPSMKRDASRWFHNVWTYKGVHQDGFIMFSSWLFYISSPVMTKMGPIPPPLSLPCIPLDEFLCPGSLQQARNTFTLGLG